jgi:hypothetical protein
VTSLTLLELALGPVVIASATLIARRFGPRAGGWLVGLPLTSGPVAVVLALQDGAAFVPGLAAGFLVGLVGQAAFALAYTRASVRGRGWPAALAGASVVYGCTAAALLALAPGHAVLAGSAVVALGIALRLAPASGTVATARRARGDLPLRMGVCSGLVLAIATLAPLAGPSASGAVSSFPVLASLLTVFAHRHDGPAAAIAVCRGLLAGAFSVVGFAVALLALADRAALAPTFALAFAATLAIHAASARVTARA